MNQGMNRIQARLLLIIPALLGASLLAATPAFADVGLGFGILLGPAPLLTMGLYTRGIALAGVVVLEAFVLWKLVQIPPARALWVSLVINILSALFGLLIGILALTSVGFLALLLLIVLLAAFWKGFPKWFGPLVLTALIVGLFSIALAAHLYSWTTGPAYGFLMYLSLSLSGFGLSLLSEGIVGK